MLIYRTNQRTGVLAEEIYFQRYQGKVGDMYLFMDSYVEVRQIVIVEE